MGRGRGKQIGFIEETRGLGVCDKTCVEGFRVRFRVRVRVLHERLERERRVGGCSRVKQVRSIEKTRGPKP
jgi:hypothetical protein